MNGLLGQLPADTLQVACGVLAAGLGIAGVAGWRSGTRGGKGRPGMASGRLLERDLGVKAARTKHGPRNRPALAAAGGEATKDPNAWGMFLGMVDASPLYAQHEDSMAVVAIPRAGKTMYLAAGLVLDAPGFALATSTKADLVLYTIGSRQQRGPVAVFDPQGVVGWPEQAWWDPVAGCADPDVALARGKAWAAAQPMEGATNASWFSDRAATVLSCLLHAAALAGLSMREVAAWASNLSVTEEPVTILANHPGAAAGWDKKLRGQVQSRSDTTAGSIEMTLSGLLDPLSSPRVMDAVCPEDGQEGLDVAELIAGGGTLYLLSTRDGGAAPLVTMLADHVVTTAMRLSQSQPGQRLDPPVRLVLDEAGTIAPLPKLPELMADSGGRGITTCAFFQTFSQMRHRWGREGADAIYAIATTRLVLGGIGEDEDLRRLSTLVGEHRVRRQSTSRNRGRGGGGSSTSTTSSYDWEPVLRPAQIRELPEGQALMFYRNRKAAVLRLRGLWQRTDWAALQQNKAAAEALSKPRVAA